MRRMRRRAIQRISSDENITQSLVKTDNRSAWYHNQNKKEDLNAEWLRSSARRNYAANSGKLAEQRCDKLHANE